MTQVELIFKHLRNGNSITSLEALDKFKCFRLADVIYKIKRLIRDDTTSEISGLLVRDKLVIDHGTNKRYSKYWVERVNDGKLF